MRKRTVSAHTLVEYAAFVGIDWADQKHTCSLQAVGSNLVERCELENSPEAVQRWAADLARRFNGQMVAVALEQPRGAVVALLTNYPHLAIHPVHSSTLDHYRKSFRPSGAKDDSSDADLILDLLQRHRERLEPLPPQADVARSLQLLVEGRRKMVDEKTRLSNRLTDSLKQAFPQVLKWFDDVASVLVGDLLLRWPTLAELQKAPPGAVRDFLHQYNCRRQERIEQCLLQIPTAVPATGHAGLLLAGTVAIQSQVRLIAELRAAIQRYDESIAQMVSTHPDFFIVDSLPGVGTALAPRILAALGSNRDRFASASELQCFTGVAPVVQSSGKQRWVHWRWACSQFLRQTFHEWALHSIPRSDWAREFYGQQRQRGKSHHAAARALAFKWQRILYRCWKDRQPYHEQIYLQARHKRGLPSSAGETDANAPAEQSARGPAQAGG